MLNDVAVSQGLADIARHVIGCRSTQETRVQSVLDDVASSNSQALPRDGTGADSPRDYTARARELVEQFARAGVEVELQAVDIGRAV